MQVIANLQKGATVPMSLPPDADKTSVPGIYVWASEPNAQGVTFYLLQEGNYSYLEIPVAEIRYPHFPAWRSPASPRELIQSVRVPYQMTNNDHAPERARAIGEIITLAASFADVLNEGVQDQIKALEERRAKERAEYEERQKQRQAEREAYMAEQAKRRAMLKLREAHLFELVKWQLGERMKCTRDGYRQTNYVHGTIDHVTETSLHITTEKGKAMRLALKDINRMWMRDGDSRKFTVLYTAGDEQKEEVTNDEH